MYSGWPTEDRRLQQTLLEGTIHLRHQRETIANIPVFR